MKSLIELTRKQNKSWHRQTFTEEKQFDTQTCELTHCMTAKKILSDPKLAAIVP